MPIYEYQAREEHKGCKLCAQPFEQIRRLSDPPLEKCPECGTPIVKIISAPNVGSSKSSLDSRAKAAGFTKLQKLGTGEYEKKY